jgi:hypothetical protein
MAYSNSGKGKTSYTVGSHAGHDTQHRPMEKGNGRLAKKAKGKKLGNPCPYK